MWKQFSFQCINTESWVGMVPQKKLRHINLRRLGHVLILALFFGLLALPVLPVQAQSGLVFNPGWGVPMYPGEAWSLTLTASGGTTPYSYQIISGSVPGVTLTNSSPSATYAGTPTTPGSYDIRIRVTDSASSPATVTVNHTFIVPQPLNLASTWGSQMFVGDSWSHTWTATGGVDAYSYSLVSGNIPGLTFSSNTASATLSGTPTAIGSYPVSIRVQDSASPTPHSFTIEHTYVVLSHTAVSMQLVSAHTGGEYRVGENVWAVVDLNQESGVLLPISPALTVAINVPGGPSCTATLYANGRGECYLRFTTSGYYRPEAVFNATTYFEASSVERDVTILGSDRTDILASGRSHTCMLADDGKINCWGDHDYYTIQDQNGNILSDITQGTTVYDQLSAGGFHTCALDSEGALHCWGDAASIVEPDSIPNVVNGKTIHYIYVDAGNDHVCAVDTRHKLHCWGEIPETIQPGIPTFDVRAVSVGSTHNCVVAYPSDAVSCWGSNATGQLDVPASLTAKKIAVGNSHTCAIRKSDSHAICWGTPLISLPFSSDVGEITSGSNYSCNLAGGGTLACRGTNMAVVNATPAGIFTAVSGGTFHVCAIQSGTGGPFLKCWGDNSAGQGPRLSLTPLSVSAYLPLNLPWSQTFLPFGGSEPYNLSAGGSLPTGVNLAGYELSGIPTAAGTFSYTLTLRESFVSGSSPYPLQLAGITQAYSQMVKSPLTTIAILSRDTNVPVGSPVNVNVSVTKVGGSSAPALTGTVTITGRAVVSGEIASCTATVTEVSGVGEAACPVFYGEAGDSQVISAVYDGDSFYQASPPATNTTRITPIIINPTITAGKQFGCSINSTGSPACWGKNDSGQSQPPVRVFKQISAGDSHVCALDAGGRINCWGWNGFGLLTSYPILYGYIGITSGEMHSCALYYNNRIDCWGDNSSGQNNRPNLSYKAVDAGARHTCGLTMDGTPRCWGDNSLGQSTAPVVSGFLAVGAGGDASCGIDASGAIQCWGGTSDFRANVPAGSYLSISLGDGQACAIDSSNIMHCWGDQPQTPSGSFGIVASGYDHSCALTSPDTFLQCWGDNSEGQAPVISVSPTTLPVLQVNQPWSAGLTASGGRSTNFNFSTGGGLPAGLLLTSGGNLQGTPTLGNNYSFGVRVVEADRSPALMQNILFTQRVRGDSIVSVQSVLPAYPQAGQAVTISVNVSAAANNLFTQVASGDVQISVNGTQVCQTTLVVGSAQCIVFFDNTGAKSVMATYGGDERFLPASSAASLFALDVTAFSQTARIISGGLATYIHKQDGSLACIGTGCALTVFPNFYSVMGVGSNLACGLELNGKIKCRQAGGTSQIDGQFVDLSVGYDHYCALDIAGQLHCWGDDSAGQSTPPVGSFTRVFSGRGGSCAIRSSDGQAVCWGNLAPAVIPTELFEEISVGDGHACGLSAGEIQCWGADTQDQIAAPNGDQFNAMTAGDHHNCALDGAGNILCWGAAESGQLLAPYGGYSALDAFGDHTCALRGQDEVSCWGDNPNEAAPEIIAVPFASSETVVNQPWQHYFNPSGGVKPYTASVVAGSLPAGISLENDIIISPAGVVASGTPTNPAQYNFVIRWKDSSNPQLVRDIPYQLTVTGANLEVEIVPAHATTVLKGDRFYFNYVLSNHTPLAIPAVRLDIELPEALAGWDDLALTGLDGCVVAEAGIQCNIDPFPASSQMTLRVTGTVTGQVGEWLSTSAQIESQNLNWPEIHPADNVAESSVLISHSSLVLSENFDDGLSPGWLSGRLVTSPSGEVYLESEYPASQALRLVMDPVAIHKRLIIRFDLLILGDWQGNGESDVSLPSLFDFGNSGLDTLVHTSFCNLSTCSQAYPGSYPGGAYAAMYASIAQNDLGYDPDLFKQVRYRVELNFPHQDTAIDLTWLAQNLPTGAHFGIDNLEITLDTGWRRVFLPLLMK